MTDRALADVTVLDFSQGVAAPAAGAFFADLGAEVIAIEPPGGKTARNYSSGEALPNIARNKRSLVLDLKAEGSETVLHRLVREADVLFHNNRPDVSEKLGMGYEALSEINPELVYCSVTGYGESGPYRDRPTIDPLAQAMSGLMWMTGEADRKPSRIGASVTDMSTAMTAAFASLAALHHARATGEGQKVETSLFDTAASIMGSWYSLYSMEGSVPGRMGHSWSTYAPSGVFETATDPIYLATPFQYLWERLCEAVDREDWATDSRFETIEDRLEHREALHEELEAEFGDYDRADLLERLHDGGVPASELNDVAAAATDEHLRERGTVTEVEDVDGEEVLAAATPATLSATPRRIDEGPPRAGEHTREVLSHFEFDDDEIDELLEAGVVTGD